MVATEGRIPFHDASTWYRIVGTREEPGRLPLLCLHGGPGGAHDYLEPLEALADGRRVVFYDQLGCGRSPYRNDPSKWTVALFLEEIGVVRKALGLDRVHLFGSSWGGQLAMEYALTQPLGLASLVIASSPASMPQWVEEANRLRRELPDEIQAVLLAHEAAQTTHEPAYLDAFMAFVRRHVCRVDPIPDFVMRSFNQSLNEVYLQMNGPSESHVIGTLKDWDIRHRLGEIRVPTLVTSGRYDEATPLIARTVHEGIVGSEWVLFEHSSHLAHVEEPERYLDVVNKFLGRIEAASEVTADSITAADDSSNDTAG